MTKVKVSIEGHYEAEEIPYGKDYKWVPAHALIEYESWLEENPRQ